MRNETLKVKQPFLVSWTTALIEWGLGTGLDLRIGEILATGLSSIFAHLIFVKSTLTTLVSPP